ncbi:MAG: hypothetical protein AAFR21_14170 [Pseudomonadota bacterium]
MVVLTFPPEEAEYLRGFYEKAKVILEYGSGGSTLMAVNMPGKLVFSVESDKKWARNLEQEIHSEPRQSHAIFYPVYIGATGKWGRPQDTRSWHRFHRYPMAIWDEPFFRHPDVVLIDGRFRPACFAAVCMRIQRPVTVLFDDYVERVKYHVVEKLVAPEEIVGRVARFELQPGLLSPNNAGILVSLFSEATYAHRTPNYDAVFDPKRG